VRMKIISSIACLLATSGCGIAAYSTMSTHTIDVGPARTADVVWVLQSNEGLLRCYEAQSGPVCVRAKVSDASAGPSANAAADTGAIAPPPPSEPTPAPMPAE
jgi:hypothetical protein